MTELDMLLQTMPETLPIALLPQAIRELQDEVKRLRRELEDCQEDLRDHKEERLRLRGGKEIKALTEDVERLKNELAMAAQVSGELCEKCGWAMKFPEEPCRCELLAKADAVFNRGVQAGREQVISYLGLQAAVFAVNVEQMQKNIRTMQFPEDK